MSSIESPRFKVKLKGKKAFTVQVQSADLIEWEFYQVKERLPEMSAVSNIWSAYVTWSASKRDGKVDADMPLLVWRQEIERVEYLGSDEVPPTTPAAEASSS